MAIAKNTAAKAAPAEKATPTKAAPAEKATPTKAAPAAKAAPVKAAAEAPTEKLGKASRKDLARLIHDKVKAAGKAVPASIAEIMVVAYEEAVAECLANSQEVVLPGFGKFVPVQKEAAEKRNPATGATVHVPAHIAVRFKVGAKLKQAVNGGEEVAEGEDSAEE